LRTRSSRGDVGYWTVSQEVQEPAYFACCPRRDDPTRCVPNGPNPEEWARVETLPHRSAGLRAWSKRLDPPDVRRRQRQARDSFQPNLDRLCCSRSLLRGAGLGAAARGHELLGPPSGSTKAICLQERCDGTPLSCAHDMMATGFMRVPLTLEP
jgi:hypothetical protein